MIICQLIQIKTYIKETLSEYYKKVNGAIIDLLHLIELNIDFMDHCPICGRRNCPQFICYYYRQVIDEDGRYYKDFPIARYKCRSKGKTFSLLPYQLVPYIKYSIPFIINTLKLRHEKGLSIYRLQDYIAGLGRDDILTINPNQLFRFKKIVIEAVNKIKASKYYPEFHKKVMDKITEKQIVSSFIEFGQYFECLKTEPSIEGPCGLNYDFYINGGGYFHNAHFLFGTASQFR